MCRSILSRTALVSDLSSKGVVNLVSDEVRQIYSLLEADFTPLELCQRLAPLLEKLETVIESMSGIWLLLMLAAVTAAHTSEACLLCEHLSSMLASHIMCLRMPQKQVAAA